MLFVLAGGEIDSVYPWLTVVFTQIMQMHILRQLEPERNTGAKYKNFTETGKIKMAERRQ